MSAAGERGTGDSGPRGDPRPRGGTRSRGGRWEAPVDPPGVLRLFFAVPVPAAARARVGELIELVQRDVGDGTARIRWVRVDGLHLTLRFLGPTPEDRVAPLEASADALARILAPFEVELSGGGAFPSLERPRSLWVGVRDGADRLASLADGLTAAAGQCGLVLDTRPFAAHLTIGRTDGASARARGGARARARGRGPRGAIPGRELHALPELPRGWTGPLRGAPRGTPRGLTHATIEARTGAGSSTDADPRLSNLRPRRLYGGRDRDTLRRGVALPALRRRAVAGAPRREPSEVRAPPESPGRARSAERRRAPGGGTAREPAPAR